MDSRYFDKGQVSAAVHQGEHRSIIGGRWDEIGRLQFEFLVARGLRPQHTLLDIGCGSLRGGVHFVRYLEPGNYFGTDLNSALLEAGYERELAPLGLADRLPRGNLVQMEEFEFARLNSRFDMALAQSVFTHLSFNRIRQCLERLPTVMKPGSTFYATFFEIPEHAAASEPFTHQPGGVTTHGERDPYHYRFTDLAHAAKGLPWRVEHVGDWNHPRGQRMAAFVRDGQRG
jgi:SAM-dependent methyltransferase